jgi:NADH-quinone oxidoreductase subunit M
VTAVVIILVLIVGGPLAWLAGRYAPPLARWVALTALALALLWLLRFWAWAPAPGTAPSQGPWLSELRLLWIPRFGIGFHFAMDGLSLPLSVITLFLGMVAVTASWTEIRERAGFYYLNLLWALAGVLGVLSALDMLLFFLFWELMLVPMYFLINLWGHGDQSRAAIRFFIFTQGSGLLLLVGILILVYGHQAATGNLTFDYSALRGQTGLEPQLAMWAMLGFFLAFAVKLPALPLHTWLPDAATVAPTGGSIVLATVLDKAPAYGLIRFLYPLFPDATAHLAPAAMALGVAGIVYGGVLAFAQSDIKRLVVYSSISHMGFVLLGVFAWNTLALQGVVMQLVAHGITAAALFMVAGSIRERVHTLEGKRLGGLWAQLPRLSAMGLLFAMATLGLPGFGTFVAEILILVGTFRAHPVLTLAAVFGTITTTVYALVLVQRAFHGSPCDRKAGRDYGLREGFAMAVMTALIIWLGLYPQPVLHAAAPALAALGPAVAPLGGG